MSITDKNQNAELILTQCLYRFDYMLFYSRFDQIKLKLENKITKCNKLIKNFNDLDNLSNVSNTIHQLTQEMVKTIKDIDKQLSTLNEFVDKFFYPVSMFLMDHENENNGVISYELARGVFEFDNKIVGELQSMFNRLKPMITNQILLIHNHFNALVLQVTENTLNKQNKLGTDSVLVYKKSSNENSELSLKKSMHLDVKSDEIAEDSEDGKIDSLSSNDKIQLSSNGDT